MALFGKTVAIASVGISCQTAHQINANREFIEDLVGEKLEEHATPFDWIICSAEDIAGMIRDGETYPTDASELSSNRRPYWARRKCWFWHEAFDDFDAFVSKRRHADEWWACLGGDKRRYFFISNTQNNLARHEAGKRVDRELKDESVEKVLGGLIHRFGRSEIHVVIPDQAIPYGTVIDAFMAGRSFWHRAWLHEIARDDSQWHGSAEEWRKVFVAAIQAGEDSCPKPR